jgi:hypothetical protein
MRVGGIWLEVTLNDPEKVLGFMLGRKIPMRLSIVLLLLAVFASSACAQDCPPSPIDQFTTQQAKVLARLNKINDPNDKLDQSIADPAAPGGFRRYFFRQGDNRWGQTAELSLRHDAKSGQSALVVSSGVQQAAALELDYGLDANLHRIPLHLKPTAGCDRLRLTFDANNLQVNISVKMRVAGIASAFASEAIMPGGNQPICVDFLFSKFVIGTNHLTMDLAKIGIDSLSFVFQPEGSIGAHDYALVNWFDLEKLAAATL